jgi:hypothetical protein
MNISLYVVPARDVQNLRHQDYDVPASDILANDVPASDILDRGDIKALAMA